MALSGASAGFQLGSPRGEEPFTCCPQLAQRAEPLRQPGGVPAQANLPGLEYRGAQIHDHYLSIVDLSTPKPFLMPRGFHLYGDTTAEVATDVGTAFVEAPEDLAHFHGLFESLRAHARHGDEALRLLEDIARSVGGSR